MLGTLGLGFTTSEAKNQLHRLSGMGFSVKPLGEMIILVFSFWLFWVGVLAKVYPRTL
jgi:hypothetical protein